MESQISITEISSADYEQAFLKYGGSFCSHPKVLRLLETAARKIPVVYYGVVRNGEIVGAIPVAGQHILATRESLKAIDLYDFIDIGLSELILPLAPEIEIDLPFLGHFISELSAGRLKNARRNPSFDFAFTKGIKSSPPRLQPKTIQTRRREMRRLEADGGEFVPVKSLTIKEFIVEYTRLFLKRRGKAPVGAKNFEIVFGELWDLMCGDMLVLNREPIAIEILYRVVNPQNICVNFVNSAVDLSHNKLSPGTVLLFHNISLCEEEALQAGKDLRFCLGTSLAPYKMAWCFSAPSFVL
jgi:Mig-14